MTRRQRSAPNASAPARHAPVATSIASPWWPIALIVAVGVAAYVNAPGHPFLFDDGGAIVDNQTIRSLWTSLLGGPDQFPTAGRPLLNASFALNYALGALEPWGYHAINLALHVLCATVLFALVSRVLRLPRMPVFLKGQELGFATALALLWVVHPLNSEIVNYATQRSEAMMALVLLATLYCGVRAITAAAQTWWYGASIVACAAGMACKESMVVAPVLMLLLDATFISGGLLSAVRARPAYYAGLFATEILLALLIAGGPRSNSAGFSSGVSPWTYLLDQAPLIVHYLRLAVWPVGLVFDYGEPTLRTLGDVWPAAAAVLALIAATVVAWFRVPAIAFLGTWFFITLAPTSSVLPIATEVGAERRMYLPLIAVLAAILVAAVRLMRGIGDPRTRRSVALGATAIACVACVSLTLVRNGEYATGIGIWQSVVDRRPTGRAHYMLGRELGAVGRRDEAIAQYRLGLDTSADAHYGMAFELAAEGRHQEAVEYYRNFIRLKPLDGNVPRAYHNLGRSLMALGRADEAAAAFRDTLARKASDKDATAGLADALFATQHWSESVTAYADYLRIAPGDPAALFGMGLALAKLARFGDARDAFASVVNLQPANVAAHVNLASALANTGQIADAVREFRRAAELEPDPESKRGLEQAIAELLAAH
ncbi:MAG: tetratricopeptide repeat protein [Vicinamibacterales bacterium]